MTTRQQWSVVLGIVLLLGASLAAATHFLGDELFPLAVGMQAPPIEGTTIIEPTSAVEFRLERCFDVFVQPIVSRIVESDFFDAVF